MPYRLAGARVGLVAGEPTGRDRSVVLRLDPYPDAARDAADTVAQTLIALWGASTEQDAERTVLEWWPAPLHGTLALACDETVCAVPAITVRLSPLAAVADRATSSRRPSRLGRYALAASRHHARGRPPARAT